MNIDTIINNIEYQQQFEYAKKILLKNYKWLYHSSNKIDIAIGGIILNKHNKAVSYIYNKDGVVFHIDRKYILDKINRYIGLKFIDMLLYKKYDVNFKPINNIQFIYRYILMKLKELYKNLNFK